MFRLSRLALAAILLAPAFGFSPAHAGQAWLDLGDAGLRADLQLLDDAGLIDLPLGAWPIPVADIDRALHGVSSSGVSSSTYDAAIARVRRAIRPDSNGRLRVDLQDASVGQASLFRFFDTAAREDAQVTFAVAKLANRWAAELEVAVVSSPEDEHVLRLDGSHVTARFGNWLLGASTLERWWGPGHAGSLILSNNARPIPALMLERATSTPFRQPVLRWLGPWRFTSLIGRMESGRGDFDNPLFMGMRFAFSPARVIDIGLSRTAQFCGEGRRCTLETLVDVLGFNDTAGVTVSPENEPGNQLAGYDVRVASPWRFLPVALYTQSIGEDRIDLRPTDRLVQYGADFWHALPGGQLVTAYAEYSDSTCSARSPQPAFNCAYNSGIFNVDGYRYHKRAIGHTTDNDSQLRAAGVRLQTARGQQWSVELRDAALNRDAVPDPNNTVTATPASYESVALGWQGDALRGRIKVQLGMERLEPLGAAASDDVFGFLSWHARP